jgi:hypothetical protein
MRDKGRAKAAERSQKRGELGGSKEKGGEKKIPFMLPFQHFKHKFCV